MKKKIVFFIWFNLWYKPKWNMCVCILVRIKWADFPFDIFFVNYIGLNSRYWYMNWIQITCNYCVKLMKIYAINKWILFLVYHFVIAPVHLCTIWMNFIYHEPTFFKKNVKCTCGIPFVDNDLFNKDIQRLSRVKNSF